MGDHVVIIGSGLGGLSCAARLSKKGFKVTVLEKHVLPGGYATHFNRGGFRFEASLHSIGGLGEGNILYNILDHCGVMSQINPVPQKNVYSIRWKGDYIDIPQDINEYKKILMDIFPEEKEGIGRLFSDLEEFAKEMRLIHKNPSQCSLTLKWLRMSVRDVLLSYVRSTQFINLFCVQWDYYGLPPSSLSAIYFFSAWVTYHIEGSYYIYGGSQELSNALVASIHENGGEVRLRAPVKKIITSGKKVTGVLLKNGEEISCDWVVCNANPIQVFNKLLPENSYTEKMKKRLARLEVGCSMSQLYLGMNCNPEDVGIDRANCYLVEQTDSDRDYQYGLEGEYSKVNLGIVNYTAMDPAVQERKQGIVVVSFIDYIWNWPENRKDYRNKKNIVMETLLNRLETYYPGLNENIVIKELATPRTMYRYTWNFEGAIYGFAQTPTQSTVARLSSKTPYENLFMVGAWTRPGGGYHGAITSGYLQAEQMIHKQKQANLWVNTKHST